MAADDFPTVPEVGPHLNPAARRLQGPFVKANALRSTPPMRRLVQAPLRTAIARAVTLAEARIRTGWSVPARTRTFWGARMRVRLPEPISTQLLGCGLFEPGLTRFMLGTLRPGDTVVDIGAHYGYFTLLAAELVGTGGRVHAFEPTRSTFGVLERNTRGHPHVTANDVAVWSQRTSITVTDLGPRLSAFNSVFSPRLSDPERQPPEARRVSVPAVPLDDYCSEHALRPAFVKIDAESAEHHILEGMRWVLGELRPLVTLEVGDFDLPDVPRSVQLVQTMTSRGYVALEDGGGDLRIHQPRDVYGYDNLLFAPAEHPVAELVRCHGTGRTE